VMGTQLSWMMAIVAGEECSYQNLVIGAAGGHRDYFESLSFVYNGQAKRPRVVLVAGW